MYGEVSVTITMPARDRPFPMMAAAPHDGRKGHHYYIRMGRRFARLDQSREQSEWDRV